MIHVALLTESIISIFRLCDILTISKMAPQGGIIFTILSPYHGKKTNSSISFEWRNIVIE